MIIPGLIPYLKIFSIDTVVVWVQLQNLQICLIFLKAQGNYIYKRN